MLPKLPAGSGRRSSRVIPSSTESCDTECDAASAAPYTCTRELPNRSILTRMGIPAAPTRWRPADWYNHPSIARRAVAIFLTMAAMGALHITGQVLLVSPWGYGAFFVATLATGASIGILIALLGFLLAWPFLLFRSTRSIGINWLLWASLAFVSFFPCVRWAGEVRLAGLRSLAERGEPIGAAIESYAARTGSPPARLEDLVPRDLSRIPSTGLPAYPAYRYRTGPDLPAGAAWELYVPTPMGGINFDRIFRLPGGVVPTRVEGSPVTPLGNWGWKRD